MSGLLTRGTAGRSATRRYNDLSTAWFERTFGRRTALYAWTVYALVFILILSLHLSSRSSLVAGLFMGLVGGAMMVIPAALVPNYIENWQIGAWGEEKTERELRKLLRDEWVVRHDVEWGDRANHDHVAAGPAVFLLNTKNVDDGRVSMEGASIRVERLGGLQYGYLADRWIPGIAAEALSFKRDLEGAVGFPVHVYPVIVVWARFAEDPRWVSHVVGGWDVDVSVVRGDKIADWIADRPADLVDPQKRVRVMEYVRSLPSA